MTEPTRVAALSPAGAGAIATVALVGPAAWQVARRRFTRASGQPLPEQPAGGETWFGRIGDRSADEVVLTVPPGGPQPRVEIHCHGGRQVVAWLLELFCADGCVESPWQDVLPLLAAPRDDARAWPLLPYAQTTRTAGILLEQCRGAFQRAIAWASAALDGDDPDAATPVLQELVRYAPVGRHLVQPWRVVIVGAPNAGKSSLLNALAGYQRSVVAPVPGTTRDVVTATLALDGWPMEWSDTAGLREAPDALEREGIIRARATLAAADLCLWLLDTTSYPVGPTLRLVEEVATSREKILFVLTKADLKPTWDLRELPLAARISATRGDGIGELAQQVVKRLVPDVPPPGAAVPFTPELCDCVEEAYRLLGAGQAERARQRLSTVRALEEFELGDQVD